ncbi:MAG TPA: ABATE domain-containing protein [Solirubrobacteraceae bacterium]|jgi:predicted RNA-binding Zn ribbon-like protein|nr:ABATE domain-containing protein [Solirubrobacteraceae bacterium]
MVFYPGPLRQEKIAIELYNTVYAVRGAVIDGLRDEASAAAWIDGLAGRLPARRGGSQRGPGIRELVELRGAVREALQAAADGRRPGSDVLAAINAASARAPRSPIVRWRSGGDPIGAIDDHGATYASIVVGALAADAVELLTGPLRADLRTCGAPGCVLMFLKDHPRREWCSNACGNRARQARHYQRSRQNID